MPEHIRHDDANPDQSDAAKEAKLASDAQNLIQIANTQSERLGYTVNPITLARRSDDNIKALQAAIAKEQGSVKPAVEAVVAEATSPEPTDLATASPEISPEQVWLNQFKVRFADSTLQKLHEGIQWIDVENSLKADPESMRKLQALDEKGHAMNVFGEEGDEFIFASAWSNYAEVSKYHRNITYDLKGQRLAESHGYTPAGNAVNIIASIMGVKEDEAERYLADPALHEQLREVIGVNGFAWLKTDAATRKTGGAFVGFAYGIRRYDANGHYDHGSFRAALRVKKV